MHKQLGYSYKQHPYKFLTANEVVAVGFLDIISTFDNVLPGPLWDLENWSSHKTSQIHRKTLLLIKVYTLLRRVISARLTLYIRDPPQSSTLSPLLFNISIREMNLQLYPGTNFLRTTLWFTLLRDKLLLISYLHLIWFICTFRTKVWSYHQPNPIGSYFPRKHSFKEDSTFKIFINNHLVERIVNIRFLDVILDCRLKGEDHFKQVIKKGKSLT